MALDTIPNINTLSVSRYGGSAIPSAKVLNSVAVLGSNNCISAGACYPCIIPKDVAMKRISGMLSEDNGVQVASYSSKNDVAPRNNDTPSDFIMKMTDLSASDEKMKDYVLELMDQGVGAEQIDKAFVKKMSEYKSAIEIFTKQSNPQKDYSSTINMYNQQYASLQEVYAKFNLMYNEGVKA